MEAILETARKLFNIQWKLLPETPDYPGYKTINCKLFNYVTHKIYQVDSLIPNSLEFSLPYAIDHFLFDISDKLLNAVAVDYLKGMKRKWERQESFKPSPEEWKQKAKKENLLSEISRLESIIKQYEEVIDILCREE